MCLCASNRSVLLEEARNPLTTQVGKEGGDYFHDEPVFSKTVLATLKCFRSRSCYEMYQLLTRLYAHLL